MNKVISLNLSDRNTEQNGVVIRSSQTILNRYKEKSAKHGGKLTLDELYKFLSGENGRILARCQSDGSLNSQTVDECREFASFYLSEIDRETRRKIFNRNGSLPFFIQKGIESLSAQSFPGNSTFTLTDEQVKSVNLVTKYIDGLHINCLISFCIINPDGDNLNKCIAFEGNASAEKMRNNRQRILGYTGYLIYYGGRMIVRQYLPERKFILSGFTACNGKLSAIPAERLKEDFHNSPKCTEEDLKNMTFTTHILP